MKYGQPKKLPDGRYYLKTTTDEDKPYTIQLNNSTLVTKFSDSDEVTISLSEKGIEKINEINTKNLAAAKEHSVEWFVKSVSEKTLEAAHTTNVNGSTMNAGKVTVNKNVVTRCYNHTKDQIDPETVQEDVQCDIILELSGLWFMKKTFGPIWRIAQLRLKAPKKKLYTEEFMFVDSDEDAPEENDEDYI